MGKGTFPALMVGDTAVGLRPWPASFDHTKCGLYSAYEFSVLQMQHRSKSVSASFRVAHPPSRPARRRWERDGEIDRSCGAGPLSV